MSTSLGTFNMATGQRCRLMSGGLGFLGEKSLHGRHLYASWLDKVANETRLVEVDLDHPLEWTCWPTPEWTGM
ncbi:MAG: hypothetical protein KF718_31165 [Polyangiaceae bacterium]|nr:hypothetical protein [Polyangiaceae bacterium]